MLSIDSATKRLQLSLAVKKPQAEEKQGLDGLAEVLSSGDILNASIASVQTDPEGGVTAYMVKLLQGERVAGIAKLETAHLCDNPGALEALQESIQVCVFALS